MDVDPQARRHRLREDLTTGSVPAVASDGPDRTDAAQGLELAFRLPSRSDDPDRRRIGAGQERRRDPARRARPLLPETVRLHYREERARVRIEEVDPESDPLASHGVVLETEVAAGGPTRGHHVEHGVRQFNSP